MNQYIIDKLKENNIQYNDKVIEELLYESLHKLDDTKSELDIVNKKLDKLSTAKYLFILSDKQTKEYDDWKEKINDLMGSYGCYDFIFSPTSIGTGVKIHSELINKSIDISHEEDW